MFKYLSIAILASLVFASCSAKKVNLLSDESLYKLGLENTKVKSVVLNNEVVGILNITYLNPTNPQKYDTKYNEFLVGFYFEDNSENYYLNQNNQKYITKELLKKDTKLYKNIPSFNTYAKYYIVKFKKTTSKKLVINLKYKNSNTSVIFDNY